MNCSFTFHNPALQSFSIFLYVTLFLLGTLLNATALWIFCCRLPKWTATTVFLVNLMGADILIAFTFPFRIYAFLHSWDLGTGFCSIVRATYFVNIYMSIFIITAIAFDRYLAICHPMKYKGQMSARKATITCCFFWIVFIIASILRAMYRKHNNSVTCFWKVDTEPNKMNLVFAVAGFLLPMVLVSFCSTKVIKTLSIKEHWDSKGNFDFRKAIHIIISNLVVFVACFLPVHIGYIVRFVFETIGSSCHTLDKIRVFIHVATIVSNTNCILDSVCYYFAAREFQESTPKYKLTFPKCSFFVCVNL
ncbi:G-protein coupled receptor 35-like [Gastrophryne carolinensis]